MLTPAQQVAAIVLGLSEDQKHDAVGRYSSISTLTTVDVSRLLCYFDPHVTSISRKLILTSTSCAGALYYEEGQFRILSAPALTMGNENTHVIVGHDGDALIHTIPVSLNADTAVLDVIVLAMPSSTGEIAALEDLMANPKVTDVMPATEDEPECAFPFPNLGDGLEATAIFAGFRAARVPMLVPLPMGHGIDPVLMSDNAAVAAFLDKLQSIDKIYAEWAQSIILIATFFEGKSLQVEGFDNRFPFFEGIDSLGENITTKSSRDMPQSTEGKAIFRRIEDVRKVNMDAWFHQHPEVYEPLCRLLPLTLTLSSNLCKRKPRSYRCCREPISRKKYGLPKARQSRVFYWRAKALMRMDVPFMFPGTSTSPSRIFSQRHHVMLAKNFSSSFAPRSKL
jgi:hypothetical protein